METYSFQRGKQRGGKFLSVQRQKRFGKRGKLTISPPFKSFKTFSTCKTNNLDETQNLGDDDSGSGDDCDDDEDDDDDDDDGNVRGKKRNGRVEQTVIQR